ncbi:Hypothetical protein FKW44_003751, partial [Caligus rogercresseyi]
RRLAEFDEDHLNVQLHEDVASREFTEKLNCTQPTILNHLHSICQKPRGWVP